jgi:hypothetical protein
MYLSHVQPHWFVAISDPEIKYSGRVNNAAFTVPIDLTSGLGGGGTRI